MGDVMRIETTKTALYTFDELPDAAKEKAREWFRESYNHEEWWDCTECDCMDIAKILGIDIDNIYFSGFSSQGDGAQFTGSYAYAKGSTKAIREHAPLDTALHAIADDLFQLQKRKFYKVSAVVKSTGHYSHEFCTSIDTYIGDDSTPYVLGTLNDLLRDFMRWIYSQLENEYWYLMSNESVDDNILCNEYEFTFNGKVA